MSGGGKLEAPHDELCRHAEITRLIYDSLLAGEGWGKLLTCLTQEFDSTYSVVLARNPLAGSVQIVATDVLPPERQRAYETYYSRLRPSSFFERDDFAEGEVFTDGLYPDYEYYLRSPLYYEFFRPLSAEHLMFMPLHRGAAEERALVLRRSRAAGFYDDRAAKRLKLLGNHLANAERLAAKMAAVGGKATNLEHMIDQLGIAAFVTDWNGRIRHMTGAADRLLATGAVLMAVGGRIACHDAALERELKTAIRGCAGSMDHPGKATSRMVRLNSPEQSERSLVASISTMPWFHGDGGTGPAALIVIEQPGNRLVRRVRGVAELFELTPAEILLAGSLCRGRSLGEHATSAHISLGTARTHLKRTLAKTETHRQAELIALLLRSSASIAVGDLIDER